MFFKQILTALEAPPPLSLDGKSPVPFFSTPSLCILTLFCFRMPEVEKQSAVASEGGGESLEKPGGLSFEVGCSPFYVVVVIVVVVVVEFVVVIIVAVAIVFPVVDIVVVVREAPFLNVLVLWAFPK